MTRALDPARAGQLRQRMAEAQMDIRARLDAMDREMPAGLDPYAACRWIHDRAVGVLEHLRGSYGARWGEHPGRGWTLRIYGIGTSCTAGPAGVLHGWCRAADRHLAAVTAADDAED